MAALRMINVGLHLLKEKLQIAQSFQYSSKFTMGINKGRKYEGIRRSTSYREIPGYCSHTFLLFTSVSRTRRDLPKLVFTTQSSAQDFVFCLLSLDCLPQGFSSQLFFYSHELCRGSGFRAVLSHRVCWFLLVASNSSC